MITLAPIALPTLAGCGVSEDIRTSRVPHRKARYLVMKRAQLWSVY